MVTTTLGPQASRLLCCAEGFQRTFAGQTPAVPVRTRMWGAPLVFLELVSLELWVHLVFRDLEFFGDLAVGEKRQLERQHQAVDFLVIAETDKEVDLFGPWRSFGVNFLLRFCRRFS